MEPKAPSTSPAICDECGCIVAKIWRRYKGKSYCSTCYKREFKKALCPKCGNLSRLHKGSKAAVCIKCEFTGKPCIRCGKTKYAIGKITEYGPVCNACSVYFRVPKLCEGCGKPSSRVTRLTRLGGDKRLCPACARFGLATCQACGKHRLLETTADGRKVCKKCAEHGDIPCSTCGNLMPAGIGKICKECYYAKLLRKRIGMNCAAFVKESMQQLFRLYAEWLAKEVGNHKAAITLNRYVIFFLEIEKFINELPLEYEDLLQHFGPLRLRRSELPMRYLQVSGSLAVDEFAKQEESERKRIEATIKGGCQILKAFHRYLNERLESGTTSLRSVRLALTPATKLMQLVKTRGRDKPAQADLTVYLQKSPGQRAAISTFIGFLSRNCGLKISLPAKNTRAAKKKKQLLEAELIKLLKKGGSGKLFQKKLLRAALAYFYDLPKNSVQSSTINDIRITKNGGAEVLINNFTYWIPEEISNLYFRTVI